MIEVRDGSSHVFAHEKWAGALPVNITAATLRILGPDGLERVGASAMVATGNRAEITVDFSVPPASGTWDRGVGYLAEMDVDGELVPRFFAIVRYPFSSGVSEEDLVAEWPGVREVAPAARGQADSGDVDRVVDLERTEADNYWKGGALTVFPMGDGQITRHVVDSFDALTGTAIFHPSRAAVVEGQGYSIRRPWDVTIRLAEEDVRTDLWKKDRRADLMVDGSQAAQLVIFKTLERVFLGLNRGGAEDFKILFETYRDKYRDALAALVLQYDGDDSGVPETDRTIRSVFFNR